MKTYISEFINHRTKIVFKQFHLNPKLPEHGSLNKSNEQYHQLLVDGNKFHNNKWQISTKFTVD